MLCTLGFDLESSSDQSKQGGIEGDGAIAVERHVHTNQTLQDTKTIQAPVTNRTIQ